MAFSEETMNTAYSSIDYFHHDRDPDLTLENFRIINGRKFHNSDNATYYLPCDEEESERLHMQHYLFRYAWQSNFSAPVEDKLFAEGTRVLDVGCGPGTWVLDMANQYPFATFIGVDLSPIFPTESKPNNVGFLQCNVLHGLPFPDNTFDMVHQRFLSAALTERKWEDVVQELVRVTKPGGFIELMEMDSEWGNPGPTAQKLFKASKDLYEARGIDGFISSRLEEMLKSTGEVSDPCFEKKSTPIGSWGGALGERMSEDFHRLAKSSRPAISEFIDIDETEYDQMIEQCFKEADEYKSICNTYRIWAKKERKPSAPRLSSGPNASLPHSVAITL